MHCKLEGSIVKASLADVITSINQEREGFSFIRKWQFKFMTHCTAAVVGLGNL